MMYASGRKFVKGMQIALRLVPRHDIISKAILAYAAKDCMQMEVAFENGALAPSVVLFGKAGSVKVVQDEHEDVRELTKPVDFPSQTIAKYCSSGRDIVARAEHQSYLNSLLNHAVVELLCGDAKLVQYLRSVQITDLYMHGTQKHMMRIVFDLPKSTDQQTLFDMVKFCILLIDGAIKFNLSPEAHAKAISAREKWHSKRPTVEEKRRRRMEEKREAKEAQAKAKLATMRPEQREKEMARRQRIERGRRMRSMTKKI